MKSPSDLVFVHTEAVRTGALTLWLCFLMVASARADAVLLFEQRDLRPGLCAALRIQLTAAAEVRCEPDRGGAAISERIEAGAARVRSAQARLGVLLEKDPEPSRVRMYLLSAREDQAVIAIEDIEDRPEPDVDRSLALKVADAFEIVQVVVQSVPIASQTPLLATLATRPAPEAVPPPTAASWSGFVEAGAGFRVASGVAALGKFALGVGTRRGTLQLEATVGAALVAAERTESNAVGEVQLRERGPLLSLRLLAQRSRFSLGAGLEGGLSFIAAQGTASDGARGERTVTLPTLGVVLDARLRLLDYLQLRLAPVLELLLVDRSFGIDGRAVIDDGFVRGAATLSLVVAFPVRRAESLQP